MSRSDWSIIAALIGCLILATWGLDSAHNRERNATAASDHSKRVEQIETDRAGLPLYAESFASNPEPQSADEREKRDLAAQEAAAVWGFWVVFFAVAQTIATIIGLFYIKGTLDATSKAVEEASNATKAVIHQQRPWMQITSIRVKELTYVEPNDVAPHGCIFANMTVECKNVGHSPAVKCITSTFVWVGDHGNNREYTQMAIEKADAVYKEYRGVPKLYQVDRSVFPQGTMNDNFTSYTWGFLNEDLTVDRDTTWLLGLVSVYYSYNGGEGISRANFGVSLKSGLPITSMANGVAKPLPDLKIHFDETNVFAS